MRRSGTARTLLLAALGLAVVVLAASVWYVATSGPGAGGDGGDGAGGDEGGDAADAPGGGGPTELPPHGRGARRKPRAGDPGGEGDEGGAGDEMDEWDDGAEGRDGEPWGDTVVVNADTLRKALAENRWADVCEQIDSLQHDGKEIPDDVVRTLFDLLTGEGRRLDAVMALGVLRDPVAGRRLADLALDASQSEDVRVAALDALSRSGQAAGFAQVRQLVESSTADTPVVRRAYLALAAMGGPEGAKALFAALAAHRDDDQTDAVLTALAKLREGDAAIAQSLRAARGAGDAGQLDLVLRVLTRMGPKAGAELRSEVRAIVESPASLASLETDADRRTNLRISAVYVGAAMGGEALDAVIGLVRAGSPEFRGSALNSLRNARGDASAAAIAALADEPMDVPSRYAVAAALGGTESRRATPALHRFLDDPDGSVREAAAAGIASVRDPASVPVILARIDASKGHPGMARQYVRALGEIGVRTALPKLQELEASSDPFWKDLAPHVRNSIRQVEKGR